MQKTSGMVSISLALLFILMVTSSSIGQAPPEQPPDGLGTLDPYVDSNGDEMFGDLHLGNNSLVLQGEELKSADGSNLTFGEREVCLENDPNCKGEQGDRGPPGPQGTSGMIAYAFVSGQADGLEFSRSREWYGLPVTVQVQSGQFVHATLTSSFDWGGGDLFLQVCYGEHQSTGELQRLGQLYRVFGNDAVESYTLTVAFEPTFSGAIDVGICFDTSRFVGSQQVWTYGTALVAELAK